jgi:hypothetical protein
MITAMTRIRVRGVRILVVPAILLCRGMREPAAAAAVDRDVADRMGR